MKYAVIQTGGKQYRVSVGDIITVERLPIDAQAEFICNEVLLMNDDGAVSIGRPYLADSTVKGILTEHLRGEKIRVAKFKSKVRYRRVTGHRQSLSKVQITAIGADKAPAAVKKVSPDKQLTKKSAVVATA